MSEQPASPEFDPTAHTIEEVNAYLEGADVDEVARVLAAEGQAEKPRKGIVEGAHVAAVEEASPEDVLGDADPYALVRAKDQAGNEYTTSRISAINAGSTVLEKSPVDGFGLVIPTKTVLDFRAEAETTTSEEN